MKSILLFALVACAGAAKLNKSYLPPNYALSSGGSSEFLQTPVTSASYNGLKTQNFNTNTIAQIGNEYPSDGGNQADDRNVNYENYNSRPERPRAALERNAAILRQVNENNGEEYSYAYETENGIVAEENGVATNGVEAQGGYSYTGDDGQVYSIRYTAGQNGFVPEGDHLPTPPPIPEEILMALEQNARDEAAGIYDDGSYNENKYGSVGNGFQSQNFVNNLSDDDSVVVNSAINQAPIGSSEQRIQPEVNKAYLPPFTGRTSVRQNLARFGNVNRQSTFNPRNGYNY